MNSKAISNHPIFAGIDKKDFPRALELLNCNEKILKKNETIFHSGTVTETLGFIIFGRVQIENTDFWGNKTIIDNLGEGNVFGETYALTGKPLMVDVVAVEESKIMFFYPKKLFEVANEKINSVIIRNFLNISMNKNLHLSQRIFYTNSKTIRGRLLSYFSSCASPSAPNAEFDIPFDRQQLSDYLQVDRSALSSELSKMKADGLIDYWKNHFRLLHRD
ncbi:Crp/Fnr family transcriptional regulator [Treponema sp. Marseille-Q3903]|uniref:Crp/Fnr family transcriptional regulator n=1 Tax=Treponema sp. Marseille-Q3903 TaxID=2766703 RepID=UPI001651CAE7|nr:Crp/Fnr family transcriptional regulator [Treponema sp. Marseille-Q3903]MBC6714511.1 Crp/Fnr family transcriptional regulator [Treponema sp. Marseille-Q3903]